MQKNDTDSLVIPQLSPLPYPTDINWGVDAVKVSVPINVEMSLPLPEVWVPKVGKPLRDGSENPYYVAELPFGLYKMRAFLWVTSSWCTIDFNPAHSVFGNDERLLPLEIFPEVLQRAIVATGLVPVFEAMDPLGNLTWSSDWLQQVSMNELELARNFFVPVNAAKALERGITGLATSRGYKRKLEQERGSFSLEFATRSVGKDSFYNKTSQLQAIGITPREESDCLIYRYETRLRSKRLDKYDLKRADRLKPENAWSAISDRFSACGFHAGVLSGGETLENIKKVSYRERERILGFSQLVALGLDHDLEPGVRRLRQKLAQELGLTLGVSFAELSEKSWSVDLWSGLIKESSAVSR